MGDLKSRPKTVREALNEARTRITALEAQLAARDEQIIAWLQHAIKSTKIDVSEGLWAGIGEDADDFISTLRIIIEGIASGAYLETPHD